jgi:hypothetical protein
MLKLKNSPDRSVSLPVVQHYFIEIAITLRPATTNEGREFAKLI